MSIEYNLRALLFVILVDPCGKYPLPTFTVNGRFHSDFNSQIYHRENCRPHIFDINILISNIVSTVYL